jgi:hypothetical protein
MFRARCVPNMYLFGTFSAQNAEESRASSPCGGCRAALANGPSLQALRRAARGGVEEYGHPAGRDATEGANPAKKASPGRTRYRTFLPRLGLAPKKRAFSDVTGP